MMEAGDPRGSPGSPRKSKRKKVVSKRSRTAAAQKQDDARSRRSARRRKGKRGDQGKGKVAETNPGSTGTDVEVRVETTSHSTGSVSSERLQPQSEPVRGGTMEAGTQTRRTRRSNRTTQTPLVCHRNQETQTEHVEEDAGAETTQTRSVGKKEPEGDKPPPASEAQASDAKASAPEGAEAPAGDGEVPEAKSYAQVVSAERPDGTQKSRNTEETPSSSRDGGAGTAAPSGSVFSLHIYAVLDKSFKFSRELDTLVLIHHREHFPCRITYFLGLKQDGYLMEATLTVDEKALRRGLELEYWYGVKKQRNTVEAGASRFLVIPVDPTIKELHLYEGFICRNSTGVIRTGLQVVGLVKSQGERVSGAWEGSAAALLRRILQEWIPAERQSTERLCQSLAGFYRSMSSAHGRIQFLDGSRPPAIKVNELISASLVQILKDGGHGGRSCSPILLGLSVFTVSRKCNIDLGVAGWAELCQLVSRTESVNLQELQARFNTPQYTVLGLMNHCCQSLVAEVVLLLPLLLKLRNPGAGTSKVDPAVEEEDWSGLVGLDFVRLRERLQSCPDKRRRMFTLIQGSLPLAAKTPLLLLGWSSLLPLEDLPEFSKLTGFPSEHLIQSVSYRLRRLAQEDDYHKLKRAAEHADNSSTHILTKVDEERERLTGSDIVESTFLSSISLLRNTCEVVRHLHWYRTAVLSYQLVLKLVEMMEENLRMECKDDAKRKQVLLEKAAAVQQMILEWRDKVQKKPLLSGKTLSYPMEIEMWDALLRVQCSAEDFSNAWRQSVEKDLRKRISEVHEVERVLVCCLAWTTIRESHVVLQNSFDELCESAIRSICQKEQEGDLLKSLDRRTNGVPVEVSSAVVVESASRFGDQTVAKLLNPQSAINYLLSHKEWRSLQLDDAASEAVHVCVEAFTSLLESLSQGSIALSDLQTCLKYGDQFRKLHHQYKKNTKSERVFVDMEVVLTQRGMDFDAFQKQRQEVDTLIKMMAKVKESITAPDMAPLEKKHTTNLSNVSMSKLVLVRAFDEEGNPKKVRPPAVLWYSVGLGVLMMARQMQKLKSSGLILSMWEKHAVTFASMKPSTTRPVQAPLAQICESIWKVLLAEFLQLGVSIAEAGVTFEQLHQLLDDCGDQGDGEQLRKELSLMSEAMSTAGDATAEPGWAERRLTQIQEYRQLRQGAAAASAVLRIAEKMKLRGNFTNIQPLRQLEDPSFAQRHLKSLTPDLFQANQLLRGVTRQQTASLEEFLGSHALVSWVKENLRSMSDVKVYVDLASISAGENDTEIDQVASFHDAVMGYTPLLYSLHQHAGFEEFMRCARAVWDAQSRDEKLPDKLRESTRLLSWLKTLKETHGSVEQSSLSLASSINEYGVYHIGWSEENTEKRCLQNMVQVTVQKGREQKRYKHEDLLELQNKLMLMSSKGEHGREQVNRFAEVFEVVQRVGSILLQMQISGNMLFRDWWAEARCSPLEQQQPSVSVTFSSLGGQRISYSGEVLEQLRQLAQVMDACHKEWRGFVGGMRCTFPLLNHFTTEQMVFLCRWIYRVCIRNASAPQQLWHLLFPINPRCTLSNIRSAYASAVTLTTEEPGDEEMFEAPKGLGRHSQDLMEFSSDDEGSGDPKVSDISIEQLWTRFQTNMSEYLSESLDIRTLARLLSRLFEASQMRTVRHFPSLLLEGKPNLVLCPETEVFTTTLGFYTDSPEQPLPTVDEILMCREKTTQDEVEIFLRRVFGQRNLQKIYSLVNPGLLGYDVGEALVETFEALEKGSTSPYRFVIVSPVTHQHRYVPSYFSNYRVPAGFGVSEETARRYLRHHFMQNLQSPAALASPDRLSVWMVSSARPAVGKSLFVDRLFEKFQRKCPNAKHIRIRLTESRVDTDQLIKILTEKLSNLREQDPVLLHIDTAGVRSGLEELLFHLLVLRCLSDSDGTLWRKNEAHLVIVEMLKANLASTKHSKEVKLELFDILPTIHCRPPKVVMQLLLNTGFRKPRSHDPLMDEQEFYSEAIQRPYQYLHLYSQNQDLDRFTYRERSITGDPGNCLHQLLTYCGMADPSWGELKSFSWFLNVQLRDCESSVFCDPDFLADQLPGFKGFIVTFMIRMARDFASPSLNTSDESPTMCRETGREEDLLTCLTLRKRWENESHPYIFFNADHSSMSFLGFNVQQSQRGNTLNAIDPCSNKVLIPNVMSHELFQGLQRQRISLTEDFDRLPRPDKIKRISCVVGAMKGITDARFDPDPTYELTADNVMKMLAIHMRFRCGIPVVIMGETGCGKTRLVRFLCALQREGRPVQNMVLVKVHGGTTAEMIYRKVREAEALAVANQRAHRLDTILFFDEANTTDAIFAIKEVLCDLTVKGEPLSVHSGLKIIMACNPYRKHSPEMIERLERAGLGYRVRAEDTEDRLGRVPLRQLVYRVHPLPPSLVSLVWDFGQLSDETEFSYIRQIVEKKSNDHGLAPTCRGVITQVLAASQKYMRGRKNECSFVSLRDVERSMKVLIWFHQHSRELFDDHHLYGDAIKTLKCLVLAVGVCYYPSLVGKEEYLAEISECFPNPFDSAVALHVEISSCQDLFLENIQTRETIAKNIALKENVFLMVVCIELRIPLFLVGKPGSSKSLAKTVVADAMQGQSSHCQLFKRLKQVHMVSFQCSPHSSPEGIIGTFRSCARFQKDKNMDEYVSVVVLDEVGLAEDSPQMPLKTLHPLLEDGCLDSDEPDPHMKVGFVGISNWALDPAKMNRGIFVSRWDPSEDELVQTAQGICSSSRQILLKIKHLFPSLANHFLSICNETSKNQFFGLRDYYSLIKMLFSTVKSTGEEPDGRQLVEAILRNFSGQPEGFDPVVFFGDVLQNVEEIPRPTTMDMVKKNLDRGVNDESRYLLLLTTNNAALHMLQQQVFAGEDCPLPEIIFGSGFPKDQEYAQICRNVNRVKTCMETGRTVVLLNMQNLYESLYDALNQYYVYLSKQQYVDLGLGSHRVKCRVHPNFRLVVVEDQKKVYEHFPVPLINRLEKHRVDRSTDLEPWQLTVLGRLREWAQRFSGEVNQDFRMPEVFIGFHGDACASALLQALEKRRGADIEDDEAAQSQQGEGETSESDKQGLEMDTVDELPVDVMDTIENSEMTQTNEIQEDEVASSMETPVGSEQERREEEVFELAKGLLLNCAAPDAVVRLKCSDLSRQEKEKLQRLYFQQQHHHSLPDFLKDFKGSGERRRFLEITTFSSLLTKLDERVVARALGLQADKILVLSLHQFDTEVSFCNKIGSFLRDADHTLHILLVQIDLEDSEYSDELVASAKYCCMNAMSEDRTCWVIFIVKVTRIQSRTQYIGFQGGVWTSVHIDDLRDSEDMSLNLLDFCGTLVSSLLKSAQPELPCDAARTPNGSEELQNTDRARLHSLSLVRSCVQKAVSLLRDPDDVASRSMQRMHILLTLLGSERKHCAGPSFQRALLSRLAEALEQREGMMESPTEWMTAEAKKREALQEGGTLRHTLWRCLQSTVTPILASLLELSDRYSNLALLSDGRLSKGLIQLWLDILADPQFLPHMPATTQRESDQEVLVQHCFRLNGEELPCYAPFSWLIRLHLESLWEESEFIPATQEGCLERMVQVVSSFSSSRLGIHLQRLSEAERQEHGLLYLHDFLLLTVTVKSREELQVLAKILQKLVLELQASAGVSAELSPGWITAAAKHFAARLDTLRHIFLLQPQLAADVLQRGSPEDQSQDMLEDILALGVCIEQTRLLVLTSLDGCESFVRRVEQLQPCLDRALGQRYSERCSAACLQHLTSIRSLWHWMLVVASFIRHVVFELQPDTRLRELALKHCNLLLNLMQESPDVRSVRTLTPLIRILNSFHSDCISPDLRFGISCPVCLQELSEPCVLPCRHVLCLRCLERCLRAQRRSCPKCRKELESNFAPTVSDAVKTALEQQAAIRHLCNSFFLEVVSSFCLSGEQRPGEGVVELLFSLIVSANGDVYRTRKLTPFLECVDNSPVVRSVLPKLLLQHSFEEVKTHIQAYLKDVEENFLDPEDRTELYLLFVNCFQDALLCSKGKEGERSGERSAEIRFLSRFARKQTPDQREDPAEFLLSLARLRVHLCTAAKLLQTEESQGGRPEDAEFLQQVRAVCEYCGNDWIRVYLLRALNRVCGMERTLSLTKSPAHSWIFPAELLRLQRKVSVSVDPFLCCGATYRAVRGAVTQLLLENRTDTFVAELQTLGGSHAVVALALFRLVTCRYASPDSNTRLSAQETEKLQVVLKHITPRDFGDFCSSLLSNRIGGKNSDLCVSPGLPPLRRTALQLLVHLDSLLLCGNALLAPLRQIAFGSDNISDLFLPTMPGDHSSEARQWLSGERLQTYTCANGHACFVGECGKPMERSRCPDCGLPIGGVGHNPVTGFTQQDHLRDRTRAGHILGEARRRSEAPERQMTSAHAGTLRLLLHLAMLQGAVNNPRRIADLIHPRPDNIHRFLWDHLHKDLEVLGQTLDQNTDNTAVTVHLVLNSCPTGFQSQGADLRSKEGRQRWERLVCKSTIDPVLQSLNKLLSETEDRMSADDGLSGSPLMIALFKDPAKMLSLPSKCPTHRSSFWTLRETLTVERFSQMLGEARDREATPLLSLFMKKIRSVRQLHHLPKLATLHSDLVRAAHLTSGAARGTIAQVLLSIPAGHQRRTLADGVDRFMAAWNYLRAEVANSSADFGVDVTLCEIEVTADSSGEFLTPGRRGAGSCLQTLIDFLTETHNSLVREVRRLSQQEDSEFNVSLEHISESQLTLCHPERELLPLVLSNCHYTLEKGGETDRSYHLQLIQTQLARRFLSGKPLIRADTSRYLSRQQQDFSVVLSEVRRKIPQTTPKGLLSGTMMTVLRSFTDVCDALFVVEIGLRFLGKTGGQPQDQLLSYLMDSLHMRAQISPNVAKGLGESKLEHSIFTWQLLTCWKSEQMLNRSQDPFPKLPAEFQQKLSEEEGKSLTTFLAVTDVETFILELHEILLLKTKGSDQDYQPHWDINSTLEIHLEKKDAPALLGLESLSEEITLGQAADVWRAAVNFNRKYKRGLS